MIIIFRDICTIILTSTIDKCSFLALIKCYKVHFIFFLNWEKVLEQMVYLAGQSFAKTKNMVVGLEQKNFFAQYVVRLTE